MWVATTPNVPLQMPSHLPDPLPSSLESESLVEKKRKKVKVKVTQSCLTLCDVMGYTVPAVLKARILERVAFPFSRGSSQPRF